VPTREILTVAERLGVDLQAADRTIPQVVHGSVAAAVLRTGLGVSDEAVLDAVAYHTTLRPGAGRLEQVVFIADKLAFDPMTPNAGYHARLAGVQDRAGLDELCWIYLSWAVTEGLRLGWRLHPNLVAAERELRPTRARL
jgi:HD superfamily phosphohydrolase YqeK